MVFRMKFKRSLLLRHFWASPDSVGAEPREVPDAYSRIYPGEPQPGPAWGGNASRPPASRADRRHPRSLGQCQALASELAPLFARGESSGASVFERHVREQS